MLYWAFALLGIAAVAAVFDMGGVATGASEASKVFFLVFLMLFFIGAAARAINSNRRDD